MFFDRLKKLCDEKGISAYKACTDVGLNRAAVAKWKTGSVPSGSTAAKLAEYFGVTTDYLLGKEEQKKSALSEPELTEDELRILSAFREMSPERQKALADLLGISDS